jgi:hypothetical protein
MRRCVTTITALKLTVLITQMQWSGYVKPAPPSPKPQARHDRTMRNLLREAAELRWKLQRDRARHPAMALWPRDSFGNRT